MLSSVLSFLHILINKNLGFVVRSGFNSGIVPSLPFAASWMNLEIIILSDISSY